MLNKRTQIINTPSASNSLVDNVKNILATFVPANHGENNQLHKAIGVKSHGTITFADNKSNRAEFIRISPDAPVMHVKEFLNRVWCRERPSLVISVTGGAKDYNMKPKLLRAFRQGLLKVARTTGAWIITGGMNTGIMKLVGEIVQINPDRSRPIHLIGVATWGCVAGFHQLDVHGGNVHYAKSRGEQKGEAPLEPNHTNFIFVDDGTERTYGGEIEFRAKLEQAISGDFFATRSTAHHTNSSQLPSLRTEPPDTVPVVLLVVEGGPNTVRTVHEAVVQNNIPAVFIEGTGRCCDLFAKAYRLYEEYRVRFELTDDFIPLDPSTTLKRYDELKHKLREDLQEELRGITSGSDGGGGGQGRRKSENASRPTKVRPVDTTDYFALVYECIDTRKNFLNIISIHSRNQSVPDIDLGILKALLNATSGSTPGKNDIQRKREQFHLAMEWNRVDVVRNYIMGNDRDWNKLNLNDLFETALYRNQTDFVKLFLDHDFSLTDVFGSHGKLSLFYQNSLKANCHLNPDIEDPLRTIYRHIIQPLIGDFFEVDVALRPSKYASFNRLNSTQRQEPCSCCVAPWVDRHCHQQMPMEQITNFDNDISSEDCMDIDKELFLWSVITGRRDFNLLFWARGKNKICAALIATLIYRKRAQEDIEDGYEEIAKEFENLAVQILNRFYQANIRACTKAIIRQIPAFGNVTWLELAIKAEAKEFISQRAVQDVLNNIWFGYIDQRETDRKLIFSTIMLWYSGFLRYHNELVKTNEQPTYLLESLNKSSLSRHKITSSSKNGTDKLTDDTHTRLMPPLIDETDGPVHFVAVGCCENSKTRILQYFGNILRFLRAPYIKFIYNLYFHMIFLLLFSYVILCDFFPLYDFPKDVCGPSENSERNKDDSNDKGLSNNKTQSFGFVKHDYPSTAELIIFIWIFTLLCEEIRQFLSLEAQTFRNKISAHFEIFWNRLDCLAIFLFYVGFGLRFAPLSECFCAARIVLSVDLTIWFLRSLDIFAAVKRLGPKLVMISEMAHDLKFFMLMLTVFILGFGVSSYSLIYGAKKFTWHLPREILNLAYWQIFGELNALDEFEENYNPNGYAVFILLVVYMAIVSILLVNLLIAMFSNTFDRLQTDTDRIWKFQRYSLICEYLSRPTLPPPLIFFSHLWRSMLHILSLTIKSDSLKTAYEKHKNRTNYKVVLDEKAASNVEIAEDALGDEVYYNHLKVSRNLIDDNELDEERVQTPQEIMLNKVRLLEHQMQIMKTQQSHMFEYFDCLLDGLKTMVGDRIRIPDRGRFDLDDSFDDVIGGNDQSKRYCRHESLLGDHRHQSPTILADSQSSSGKT